MKVYKKNLPDGVKKMFALDRGVKVKLINKKYCKNKKSSKQLYILNFFLLARTAILVKVFGYTI